MAFTMIDASAPIISVKITGELGKAEVGQRQAAALAAIRSCGKISALFVIEDFHGWKRESGWGDLTFMTEHDKDIVKLAVVGDDQRRDLFICVPRQRLSSSSSRIFPSR